MSLEVGRYRLRSAHESLLAGWEETRLAWQDQVRANFEKEHLEPIAPLLLTTLGAIDQLSQILGRVRLECSE